MDARCHCDNVSAMSNATLKANTCAATAQGAREASETALWPDRQPRTARQHMIVAVHCRAHLIESQIAGHASGAEDIRVP